MVPTDGIEEECDADATPPLRVAHLFGGREGGGICTAVANVVANTDRQRVAYAFILLKRNPTLMSGLPSGHAVSVMPKMFSGDPFVILRIIRYCMRENIRVLHSHSVAGNFYARVAGLFLRRTVVVTSVHARTQDELRGAVSGRRRAAWLHFLDLRMHSLSSRLIAVSGSLRDHLIEQGIPPEKITVIPHGIQISTIDVSQQDLQIERQRWNLPTDAPVLGIVGRLTRVKNHEAFFQAAKRVVQEFPSTVLLVVGDGALRTELERLSAELGLAKNTRFTGWVDHVYPLLHLIDVLVMCSISEGFGLVVLESMACGRAVVANNVSEMPHIIKNGVSGMLVPPDNIEALSNSITNLLRKPDQRGAIGRRAAQVVHERFQLHTEVASTIDVYCQLAEASD